MSEPTSDPIVEAADVGALGAAPFLDVRDAAAFAAGRLKGAVRVPIERWEEAAKSPDTSLANLTFWESQIGALGVDGRRPVAIYDDGRMTEAARVWFILQHFGAPSRIVNGGWPALRAAFPPRIDTGEPATILTARFTPGKGARRVGLLDRNDVKAQLDSGTRIFDARTAAEFAGDDLRKNARGGHLPGAINLAHADLLYSGHLRPASELHDLLERAGFRSGDPIITHCDGGGRAALAAVAALRAGYANVDAYYLSFADWAKDESCPVVTDRHEKG